jgi:flagellar biosynthesis protein FliR
MEISLDMLLTQIERFFFPLTRFGAMMLVAPFFGARTIPVRLRLLLSLVLTVVLMPEARATSAVLGQGSMWIMLLLQQVLIGIGMGFMIQVAMSGIIMAGQQVAIAMGLGFASSIDPQNGVQTAVVGQVYLILGTLIFLMTDSHLLLLQILSESFETFPLGYREWNMEVIRDTVLYSARMFEIGLLIALPVFIGVLTINIGLGVMTKAAPQLNVFSIGFPMTMLGGFLLILFGIPAVIGAMEDVFMEVLESVRAVFGVLP